MTGTIADMVPAFKSRVLILVDGEKYVGSKVIRNDFEADQLRHGDRIFVDGWKIEVWRDGCKTNIKPQLP